MISSSQSSAEEKDTKNAIGLMSGPRVRHYWDGDRRVGTAIAALIDGLEDPAWDFWMLYPAGVTWPEDDTPAPGWWEHRLWALGRSHTDRLLEADRFAAKAEELSAAARNAP